MSGLTNRPTSDSIRMLPIGEVAALPTQHLALLQEDAAAALEASKKAKDWIDGAIALRFADHVQALRREARKDTGTVRFEQDGVTVVADLPKRVDWDQALIAGVVERISRRQNGNATSGAEMAYASGVIDAAEAPPSDRSSLLQSGSRSSKAQNESKLDQSLGGAGQAHSS